MRHGNGIFTHSFTIKFEPDVGTVSISYMEHLRMVFGTRKKSKDPKKQNQAPLQGEGNLKELEKSEISPGF